MDNNTMEQVQKARSEAIDKIITTEALSMTANTTDEYLRWFCQCNNLRASIEPISMVENYRIARGVASKIAEYQEN